jgi:hypothetical protein
MNPFLRFYIYIYYCSSSYKTAEENLLFFYFDFAGDQKMIISTKPVFTVISARLFLKEPCGIVEASEVTRQII